jgi:hypothetical protein
MLFDPDPRFINDLTGGDVPLSQKLQMGGSSDRR